MTLETRPLELRGGLGRVAQGLIAYGIVGLVVAAICLVALIWVNGKVGGLRTEAETTVGNLATTMDRRRSSSSARHSPRRRHGSRSAPVSSSRRCITRCVSPRMPRPFSC